MIRIAFKTRTLFATRRATTIARDVAALKVISNAFIDGWPLDNTPNLFIGTMPLRHHYASDTTPRSKTLSFLPRNSRPAYLKYRAATPPSDASR